MKWLIVVGGAVAAVGLFLLATASADTTLFARHYPLLLGLNAALAALLAALVGTQLVILRFRSKRGRSANSSGIGAAQLAANARRNQVRRIHQFIQWLTGERGCGGASQFPTPASIGSFFFCFRKMSRDVSAAGLPH